MDKKTRNAWTITFSLRKLLVASLLFCLFFDAGADNLKTQITPQEVITTIRTGNISDIVSAMNTVKRNQESTELLKLIVQLWEKKNTHGSELPANILDDPRVRIEIANILIQASNNGFVEVNRKGIRKFVRSVIDSSSTDGKATALLTLGLFNNPDDVDVLTKNAIQENPLTFRAAVLAIAKICHPKAERALLDLRSRVKRVDHIEFVQQPIDKLAPYRQCNNS